MYFNFGIATEAVQTALESKTGREMMELKQFLADDVIAATEAVDRVTRVRKDSYTNKYLTYLVNRVEAKAENVNWGDLPNTKGNIIKWKLNTYISAALDIAKSFSPQNATVIEADKLYQNIVQHRADFEYGYKSNNRFIILTYQAACFACVDVVMLALIEAENDAIGPKGVGMVKTIRPSQSSKTLMKSVTGLNAAFTNGDWSKIVKGYRTANINTFKATESVTLMSVAASLSTVAIIAAVSITGGIAILSAIRGLISIYYRTAVNINTKARSMQAYLDETMPYEQNTSALEKQRKAHASLDKIAGFIEAHIIKDDARAAQEIKQEDIQGLSPAALSSMDNVGEISEFSFS